MERIQTLSDQKPIKLLMRWDVRPETESEYFEFLVHEFIPALNNLGIANIQVWYTAYGDCEQKLTEGVTQSAEEMRAVLISDEWESIIAKLDGFVDNYSLKTIPATGGFQL